jgi:hypothetical protein
MTKNRSRTFLRLARLALVAIAFPAAGAQTPPRRLELSDTARTPPEPRRLSAAVPLAEPRASDRPAADARDGASFFRDSFVRDQTVLGLLVYAPSLATAVTSDRLSWGATYLLVGAGTYFAAWGLSSNLTISEPASWFATQVAVRAGLSGWAISLAAGADRRHRAGAIFLGSLGGAAAAVALGSGMSEGEVAASVFGADLASLGGLAATHIVSSSAAGQTRASVAAVAGLVGYPLGYWYANNAPYRVSAGDVTTLWASTAIGATAAGAFIANGRPSATAIATVLSAGAAAGAVLGDRFLVRRWDHSPEDGQMVALGAAAGGVMGAGVAMLTGATHERISAATAALAAVGAVGGIVFMETWKAPPGDGGHKLARLELSTPGLIAAAAGVSGTHTILHWTF